MLTPPTPPFECRAARARPPLLQKPSLYIHEVVACSTPEPGPQHYEKLGGASTSKPAAAGAADGQAAAASKDISALLAEEVATIKEKSKRLFTYHDVGIRGCCYIIFPAEPGEAVTAAAAPRRVQPMLYLTLLHGPLLPSVLQLLSRLTEPLWPESDFMLHRAKHCCFRAAAASSPCSVGPVNSQTFPFGLCLYIHRRTMGRCVLHAAASQTSPSY